MNTAAQTIHPIPDAPNLQPPLLIRGADYERLYDLADAVMHRAPDIAARLLAELDRATVSAAPSLPGDVVGMGTLIDYRDESTGRIHTIRLVYPNEADIETGRVSILTPIGTALIGLRVGQSIDWLTRSGEHRSLTVLGTGSQET